MNLVQRTTGILARPRPEWDRIDQEPATSTGLITGYAAILALLPAIGSILGGLLFAGSMGGIAGVISLPFIIVSAILGYVISLGVTYLMGIIANALAPNFGGARNPVGAMKLVVYSATATWVAGFFSFIPILGFLIALAGFAYAAYLLYLGSTQVMHVPASSAGGYTAAVIAIWIVIYLVITAIFGGILAVAMLGTAALGAAGARF